MISFSSSSSTSSILFFIITITISFYSSNGAYNVVTFGANPDGKTDSTLPFLRAWSAACSSTRPAIIYVSRGNFLIRAVVFGGPCKRRIVFRIDGTLLAPLNYWNPGNSAYFVQWGYYGFNLWWDYWCKKSWLLGLPHNWKELPCWCKGTSIYYYHMYSYIFIASIYRCLINSVVICYKFTSQLRSVNYPHAHKKVWRIKKSFTHGNWKNQRIIAITKWSGKAQSIIFVGDDLLLFLFFCKSWLCEEVSFKNNCHLLLYTIRVLLNSPYCKGMLSWDIS